jgi:hypothetical protein
MNCGNGKTSNAKTLAELIDQFLQRNKDWQNQCSRNCQQDEISFYKDKTKSIEEVIKLAAQAVDEKGNRHPHQRRLQKKTLDAAKKKLLANVSKIIGKNNFDSLHSLIDELLKNEVFGAGVLYRYDTTFRIGIRLGIYPKNVYLHAGTKDGAIALGFYTRGKKFLEMSELTEKYKEFEKFNKAYQIEDFLCIELDALRKLATSTIS